MKTRLLGAFVLFALLVIFVPMFFSSSPPAPGGEQSVSLAIPPAPDRDLKTQTMSLAPDAASPSAAGVPAATAGGAGAGIAATGNGGNATVPPSPAAASGASSDQLATVNIGSNRPRDVETDPTAGQKPEPTTVTRPGAAAPAIQPQAPPQPAIPAQPPRTADRTPAARTPPPAASPAPAAEAPGTAGVAARGSYTLNLSAYSPAGAQKLIAKVRALGYPAGGRTVNRAGQALTLVSAGPFETRAAAEAARLKIGTSVGGVHPVLESGAGDQQGDAPAAAAPARAGGFAVQVAAMGSQADANALRDKLRAGGFDGFVDTVDVGGKRLWRVRAGPQTQRADAERLRDQIKSKLGLPGNIVTVP